MDRNAADGLAEELNAALEQGWKALSGEPDYKLAQDFFDELADSGFFEQKFRGRIPNPAHDFAVKLMSKHACSVLAQRGISLEDFYPGEFQTSTGEIISAAPGFPEYEQRHFHNIAWKNGQPYCDIRITICHIRGKFEFPKAPFVTVGNVY